MTHGLETPYDRLGGADGLKRIVARFYRLMDTLPEFTALRAQHGFDLSQPQQALYDFLSGWLGGPALYFAAPGRQCVMSAHARLKIGAEEVRQWLECMELALDEIEPGCELKDHIMRALAGVAARMRNRP